MSEVGTWGAWRLGLSVAVLLLASEFAWSQQYERVCENLPDGTRRCVVVDNGSHRPPGNGPGHGPGHGPGRPPGHGNPGNPGYPGNPGHGQPGYPGYPGNGPVYGSSYLQTEFRRGEQEALRWDREMQRYAYGTWNYNYAQQQRDREINNARAVLNDRMSLVNIPSYELEAWGVELRQSMSRFSYGTAMWNFYSGSHQQVWGAFNESMSREIQGLVWRLDDLRAVAEDLQSKMTRYSYGSVEFNAYSRSQQEAFGSLELAAREEGTRTRDIGALERRMEEFDRLAQSKSYGTVAFNAYVQVRSSFASEAEARFSQEARRMPPQHLYQWQQYYNSQASRYSYGTALYNHYSRMRDIARAALP